MMIITQEIDNRRTKNSIDPSIRHSETRRRREKEMINFPLFHLAQLQLKAESMLDSAESVVDIESLSS